MTKDQLEYHLNKDGAFGINVPSKHGGISWIMLSKRKNIPRFFDRFANAENLDEIDRFLYEEQLRIKELPYVVWMAEIKSDVYAGERFPGPDDYYKNKNFELSSLDEAEELLNKMNLSLTDLKWPIDFDFL